MAAFCYFVAILYRICLDCFIEFPDYSRQSKYYISLFLPRTFVTVADCLCHTIKFNYVCWFSRMHCQKRTITISTAQIQLNIQKNNRKKRRNRVPETFCIWYSSINLKPLSIALAWRVCRVRQMWEHRLDVIEKRNAYAKRSAKRNECSWILEIIATLISLMEDIPCSEMHSFFMNNDAWVVVPNAFNLYT